MLSPPEIWNMGSAEGARIRSSGSWSSLAACSSRKQCHVITIKKRRVLGPWGWSRLTVVTKYREDADQREHKAWSAELRTQQKPEDTDWQSSMIFSSCVNLGEKAEGGTNKLQKGDILEGTMMTCFCILWLPKSWLRYLGSLYPGQILNTHDMCFKLITV